jgi:hypothetical protein
MSTNCRTLDEMTEAEAIEYVKLLIERLERRTSNWQAILDRRAARGEHVLFDESVEQHIQLDSAIVEVLKRLTTNP